jgi:hypothetical protein
MTMNPDLIIGASAAVGDVKYKVAGVEWNRSDLYQSVAFAAALRTRHAAVVTFLPPGAEQAPDLKLGDISVRQITWPADSALEPRLAEAKFIDAFASWLATFRSSTPLVH